MPDHPHIKDISPDTLSSFKLVRQAHTPLYGQYRLFSKNGLKYIGKTMPKGYKLVTWRNGGSPVLRCCLGDQQMFLFGLYGEGLDNFVYKSRGEEVRNWVDRMGSVQVCLWEIARLLLKLVEQNNLTEIVLDGIRIHNGDLQYCYDNWMTPAHLLVLQNQNQLQNHFLSHQDLQHIRSVVDKPSLWTQQQHKSSKQSLYFRVFMLVLQLGTSNLNYRNYEYGLYQINREHMLARLDYFCSRYNSKGLGTLTRKVIEGQIFQMQQIWKVFIPQMTKSKISCKSSLSCSSSKVMRKSLCHHKRQNKQNMLDVSKLQNSLVSEQSNKSSQEDYFANLEKSACNKTGPILKLRDSNVQEGRKSFSKVKSSAKMKTSGSVTTIGGKSTCSGSKVESRGYKVTPHQKQLNLLAYLHRSPSIPPTCTNILKYLQLYQHIPQNKFQQTILQTLQTVHIKNNWIKQFYQNGSVYLGQFMDNKKHGKGMYVFNSNDFYYGDWKENTMDGYGTYVFVSGQIYQGEISKGCKQGHGRCVYQDGREYQGMWISNNKVGLGKVKFPHGVTFLGIFQPQHQQTEGLFLGPLDQHNQPLWQNKGILQQYNWQKNQMMQTNSNSQSKYQKKMKLKSCSSQYYNQHKYSDGSIYEGQMLNNIKQGFGIFQTQQERYQGEWQNGKKEGRGTLFVKNRFSILGRWEGDVMTEYLFDEQTCPI